MMSINLDGEYLERTNVVHYIIGNAWDQMSVRGRMSNQILEIAIIEC
jgi:hypothetical protein